MSKSEMLQCYNRGCGQKYAEHENNDNSCRHHPGEPVFHDAYKGWSCCKKKCTDFTEFLNIQGCTTSKHSNVKPPEPEKVLQEVIVPDETVRIRPIIKTIQRPPYDTPLNRIQPHVAPSLQHLTISTKSANRKNDNTEITIGTSCLNRGCNTSYQGPETDNIVCIYHPGVPIFHEGLKFWSCCQKRSTDFNAFLNQVGCETGRHLWKKGSDDSDTVQCRWDFHQTGSHVVVSVYAKDYCPTTSVIELNPIRLCVKLVFPQESNAEFNLDVELYGVVDVNASEATMYGTKVEIKLRKAEPGAWKKLEISKIGNVPGVNETTKVESLTPKVAAVNLDDL